MTQFSPNNEIFLKIIINLNFATIFYGLLYTRRTKRIMKSKLSIEIAGSYGKQNFFAKHAQKGWFEHLQKQPWGRTFTTGDLILYLVSSPNPYSFSLSSLICSDNMVYISPIHVVGTRPMFLWWCIVMRVWLLIRKCASLHKNKNWTYSN